MPRTVGDTSSDDLVRMTPKQLYRELMAIRTALGTEKTRLSIAYAACERLALAIQYLAKPQGKSS